MLTIRRAADRGRTVTDWLDSRHTFSFGDYRDPAHVSFRTLRVINDDRVAPGAGFPTHFHRDMEILSIVLYGELEHRDSLGNGSVIGAGDVQRMTAGSGVEHSEFNPSSEREAHFLQVWILPERRGLPPGYEQRAFPPAARRGRLVLVASRDGRDGSLTIHQDADVRLASLAAGERVVHRPAPGRGVWVHLATGSADVEGTRLAGGDGAAVEGASAVAVAAHEEAEVLLFDLG